MLWSDDEEYCRDHKAFRELSQQEITQLMELTKFPEVPCAEPKGFFPASNPKWRKFKPYEPRKA